MIVDLAGAAMVAFALTGVYLWYKRTRRHALGWTVLALSCGYAVAMIVYLL